MQLGKAELIGVLNDQGIDIGNVDARFDDGRADQDLHLALGHALHDVAELLLAHLAVGHGDLGIRQARA